MEGPFCDCWPINHVIAGHDGTIWAGGGGDWNGAGVWRSTDGGESWEVTRLTKGQVDDWAATDPDFAKMIGWTAEALPYDKDLAQIWSLHHAHGVLYAGTKPATLLASHDGGLSFEKVEGLSNHPSASSWNPGGAGLVLHTILSHPGEPQKLWVGISGRRGLRHRGWRRDLGSPQPAVECRMFGPARPPCRPAGWRGRTLRPQHDAGAGIRGPDLSAEPPRRLA